MNKRNLEITNKKFKRSTLTSSNSFLFLPKTHSSNEKVDTILRPPNH